MAKTQKPYDPATKEEAGKAVAEKLGDVVGGALAKRQAEVAPFDHNAALAPYGADAAMGPPMGSIEGIGELKVTEAEAQALTSDLDPGREVDIRSDGIVYHPHIFVRRRLLKAFGPGGWGLRPERQPGFDANRGCVFWDGSLWVRGKFISRSVGQCRWHENNKQMTLWDAMEGAKSDCLTRCCKDLGIGSELWDPQYREKWKAQYAMSYRDKGKTLWKRKAGAAPAPGVDEPAPAQPAPARQAGNGAVPFIPTCPKCNGEMWDNRQQRLQDKADIKAQGFYLTRGGTQSTNPRPAWRCKNKECGTTIWSSSGSDEKKPAPQGGPPPESGGAPASGSKTRGQLMAAIAQQKERLDWSLEDVDAFVRKMTHKERAACSVAELRGALAALQGMAPNGVVPSVRNRQDRIQALCDSPDDRIAHAARAAVGTVLEDGRDLTAATEAEVEAMEQRIA